MSHRWMLLLGILMILAGAVWFFSGAWIYHTEALPYTIRYETIKGSRITIKARQDSIACYRVGVPPDRFPTTLLPWEEIVIQTSDESRWECREILKDTQ